jgi:hypothetical protein
MPVPALRGLLIALLLAGCAVIPDYPSQLPALMEADRRLGRCPDIAGHYQDEGRAVRPDGRPGGHVSLTRLLHDPATAIQAAADVVEVIGPKDDVVEIRSLHAGTVSATWQERKFNFFGDREAGNPGTSYVCEKGFVRPSDFVYLRKSIDGSLIALHRASGGPVLLWYRFPPVEDRATEVPEPAIRTR